MTSSSSLLLSCYFLSPVRYYRCCFGLVLCTSFPWPPPRFWWKICSHLPLFREHLVYYDFHRIHFHMLREKIIVSCRVVCCWYCCTSEHHMFCLSWLSRAISSLMLIISQIVVLSFFVLKCFVGVRHVSLDVNITVFGPIFIVMSDLLICICHVLLNWYVKACDHTTFLWFTCLFLFGRYLLLRISRLVIVLQLHLVCGCEPATS